MNVTGRITSKNSDFDLFLAFSVLIEILAF